MNRSKSSLVLNSDGTVIAERVSFVNTVGFVTSTGTTKRFISLVSVSVFKLVKYGNCLYVA